MMIRDDHERLMYEIMGSISALNVPIVFKGALVTKLVLAENQFSDISRETGDIDANWIGTPPKSEYLVDVISKALSNVSDSLHAKLTREYGDKKSAGIIVMDSTTNDPGIEMDISINKIQESKTYTYGDLTITGVLPTEILADKICVLSSRKIFRRAKDLVDIYALAHCVEVRTSEIYESHERNGRILGSFTEFNTRKDDLNHAYQKLRGIENKPQFEDVYQYVSKFVQPFGLDCMVDKVWNPQRSNWSDPPVSIDEQERPKKRTLSERLKRADEKVREYDEQNRNAKQHLRKNEPER